MKTYTKYQDFVDDVNHDAALYGKNYAQHLAKAAADRFTKLAGDSISEWYASYSPAYYYRTDDLLHNSYSRLYVNKGTRFIGGVHIGPEKMQAYAHIGKSYLEQFGGDNPGAVVTAVWREGFRGYRRNGSGGWERLPGFPVYDLLVDKATKATRELMAEANLVAQFDSGYRVLWR